VESVETVAKEKQQRIPRINTKQQSRTEDVFVVVSQLSPPSRSGY